MSFNVRRRLLRIPRVRAAVEWATSHGAWFWSVARYTPGLSTFFNRWFISGFATAAPPRPHRLSLRGRTTAQEHDSDYVDSYVSWTGLVERRYTGRQLPPVHPDYVKALPPIDDVGALFERRNDQIQECSRSTALLAFFAQWLTDSFLRTDGEDIRKTTSNHELDLCQIYGLTEADTSILRDPHNKGELAHQFIGEDEFPQYLFDKKTGKARPQFAGLSYIDPNSHDFFEKAKSLFAKLLPDYATRRLAFFAVGLERGNSTFIYSALNTLFLREHNRLARQLAAAYPRWSSDRVFETARAISTAQYLRIILEDYIAHISPTLFKFYLEVDWDAASRPADDNSDNISWVEKQIWYRTNRINAEFNLLYRWHQLVPRQLGTLNTAGFVLNNNELVTRGLAGSLHLASSCPAGRITLHNTPDFLLAADKAAIAKSRAWRLRPYVEYLDHFGVPRPTSFEELTGDKALAAELHRLYDGRVELVEFPIGVLAERRRGTQILGPLMTVMVGYDAFTHALTNPLLAKRNFNADTFTSIGLESIKKTSSLADLLARNSKPPHPLVDFTRAREIPGHHRPVWLRVFIETVDFFFVRGWKHHFATRQARHRSTVFRVNVRQPAVAALDHAAMQPLFASACLQQDYGFNWATPPRELVGFVTPSIFESGPAHDEPKQLYMALIKTAIGDLEPVFDRLFETRFNAHASRNEPFEFTEQIEHFAVELVFDLFLRWRPDPIQVVKLYFNLFMPRFVHRLKPGSFEQIKGIYANLVQGVQNSPAFKSIVAQATDSAVLRDQTVLARQITFLLGMNAFLGTQSLLKSIVGELGNHPTWRERIREELLYKRGPSGGISVVDQILYEVLRLHSPVSFLFGRATIDQDIRSSCGTFRLRKGELLMGVIPFVHRDPRVFRDPEVFDPGRFADGSLVQMLVWPRGSPTAPITSQDKTCPGRDLAFSIGRRFIEKLSRDYDWSLAEPATWHPSKPSLNMAAPEGPLVVSSFHCRLEAAASAAANMDD